MAYLSAYRFRIDLPIEYSMKFHIPHPKRLRKILYLDFFMGSSNGALGLIFCGFWASFLGLPYTFLLWVFGITSLYAVGAFTLARAQHLHVSAVRVLVAANWAWVAVDFVFLYFHFGAATLWGQLFLLLQIVVVGGLAWLEGREVLRVQA